MQLGIEHASHVRPCAAALEHHESKNQHEAYVSTTCKKQYVTHVRICQLLVELLIRVVITQAVDVAVGLTLEAVGGLDGSICIIALLGNFAILRGSRQTIRTASDASGLQATYDCTHWR